MHVELESEMGGIERDRFVDVVDDVSDLNGAHLGRVLVSEIGCVTRKVFERSSRRNRGRDAAGMLMDGAFGFAPWFSSAGYFESADILPIVSPGSGVGKARDDDAMHTIQRRNRMAVQASQVRTMVNAPASAVWQALTNLATFKQFFFGSDVSTDWKVGSPITFKGSWKGKPYEDKGIIETSDRERRLAFTHWSPLSGMTDSPENYHIVSFDLRPAKGGTEVVLTQTNRNDAEPLTPENRRDYEKNWTMVLEGLKKAVESKG
jgi:uncharacterized protein YndB with AHSA1/START domain